MRTQPRVFQLVVAISSLVVGVLVYLIDRQPASVYFIPDWSSLADSSSLLFGEIGSYLPTFLHVFAFILLTVFVVTPTSSQLVLICATWFVIDSFFEIGQIAVISQWIASHVPGWWVHMPILENTSAYFVNGTFDVLDLLSIAAGTVTAWLLVVLNPYGGKRGVS